MSCSKTILTNIFKILNAYNLLILLNLFRSLHRDLHYHGQDTSASPGSCSHPCGRPDDVRNDTLEYIHHYSAS